MAQVTGIVKVYVNGKLYRSKKGATLKTGGKKREAVVGHKVYGFSEEIEASALDCTLVHMADTDVSEINGLTEATLRFETDTGVTYLVTNAFTTEPTEIKEGGDMPLKMSGDPADKE